MTLANIQGHPYPYGAQLFGGAVGSDAKIDWTNDTIMIAAVGPYNNAAFVQDKTATTQKYWQDIYHFDIFNQATPTFPISFTGNSPMYGAAGGVALTTLAPYLDITTNYPSNYVVLTASYSNVQAPVNTAALSNNGTYSGTLNGVMFTNMSYSAMQGFVVYKKTGSGTNSSNSWPLLTYLDYSGGSINSLLTGTTNLGQKVVPVTSGTGFVAGQTVTLFDNTPQSENLTIATGGVSGNNITMTTNLVNTYHTANGAYLIQGNNASADKFTASFSAITGLITNLVG